jgi:hypothetical protein
LLLSQLFEPKDVQNENTVAFPDEDDANKKRFLEDEGDIMAMSDKMLKLIEEVNRCEGLGLRPSSPIEISFGVKSGVDVTPEGRSIFGIVNDNERRGSDNSSTVTTRKGWGPITSNFILRRWSPLGKTQAICPSIRRFPGKTLAK